MGRRLITVFLVLVVNSVFFNIHVLAVSLEDDLTLTYKQKIALDQFKESVWNKLPHDYMKDDLYLIRWLRAREFNIKRAEEMLANNLIWREVNGMDTIHEEDWTDYRSRYKYWIDGEDKQGRPILLVDVGEWDLRRAVVSGQRERIGRFIDKVLDEAATVTRNLRLKQGKNVTQYYHIFDMDGYNLIQQGCPACIPLIIRLVTTYETHQPGGAHKVVMVNTPAVYQSLLQIVKPLMSPMSRDNLFIFGRNKKQFANYLLNEISSEELSSDLGGTRIMPEI